MPFNLIKTFLKFVIPLFITYFYWNFLERPILGVIFTDKSFPAITNIVDLAIFNLSSGYFILYYQKEFDVVNLLVKICFCYLCYNHIMLSVMEGINYSFDSLSIKEYGIFISIGFLPVSLSFWLESKLK
jgi:hypothetical protein